VVLSMDQQAQPIWIVLSEVERHRSHAHRKTNPPT
jgi:hypothetical protein